MLIICDIYLKRSSNQEPPPEKSKKKSALDHTTELKLQGVQCLHSVLDTRNVID